MASPQTNRPEDWKDQYFKALIELDDAERTCAEKLGRLSRDLVTVLTAFRGLDTEFDDELKALSGLRELHAPEVQQRLRNLVDTVERHGRTGGESPAPASPESHGAPGGVRQLRALLDGLAVPDAFSGEVDRMRAHLASVAAQADEIELVREMAAAISRMLTCNDDGVSEARDSLQTLIDHLSLPASAHERLEVITPRLQAAEDAVAVRAAAKDLAGFVVEYVAELHGDLAALNAFLLTIKGRLNDVSGHMTHEQQGRTEAAIARRDLDDSVRRSLGDMRAQIDDTSDIDLLKREIEAQLSNIDDSVNTFVAEESKRASNAEERTRALTGKLADLERESESLRDKLVRERERAVRDPLTTLPNRLAYNERLSTEYARFNRAGHPLSLVVLDIDRFKSINDTYGHQVGDRVLKHMARELQSQIRAQDFFGRYGGEEFVVILPDTPGPGALELAEKLRAHMEACRFKYKDTRVRVTISCGVATFARGESADTVFRRADASMYAAKRSGRNRCVSLDPR